MRAGGRECQMRLAAALPQLKDEIWLPHIAMDSWLSVAILALAVLENTVLMHPMEDMIARISFSYGDPSRTFSQFSKEGYQNYSTLLLSKDKETLYVGARDILFSVSTAVVGSMELIKELHWKATENKVQECSFKGKSKESDCFNFIRVILPVNKSHIYTCGTYAFSPTCTYIDVETFSLLTDSNGFPLTEDGKGRCPFDPMQKYTATMVDGELYTGTTNNFLGTQSIIARNLGHRVPLKMEPSSNWLQEPIFVGSTFIPESEGDKVYFFFTETRSTSDLLQKMSLSMVARVCKSDVGGERVLQKRWTTFLKAQMLCYLPEDQFPFNILQDVFVSQDGDEPVFYGVFSSQWYRGGSNSSAVCAFTLRDVQEVFSGQYKQLNRETLSWSTYSRSKLEHRPGACNIEPSMDSTLSLVKDLFLMDGVVHPIGHRPLLKMNEKYVKIAVDNVRSLKAVMYRVMFLITDHGFLHKALHVNGTSYIIEELQLFATPQLVYSLKISPEKRALYIGSSTGVLQVPVSNCTAYQSCGECVLSRDPYCAWHKRDQACKEMTHQPNVWIQDIENADAASVCSPPLRPRAYVPKGNVKGSGFPLEKAVRAHSFVSLPCKASSNLAQKSWTHNGGEVPMSELMSQPAGLGFFATTRRQGLWQCWATENHFRTLLVSYSLQIIGGSVEEPISKKESTVSLAANGGPQSHMDAVKTYWSELVVVSVFLALFVVVVVLFAVYRYSEGLRSRGKVQEGGSPEPESVVVSGSDLETLPLNCKGPVGNGSYQNPQMKELGASKEREDHMEVMAEPAASLESLKGPPQPSAPTQVDI
ncbi:semaphorin-4B-like isoform X2 [Heterodontus francisci]|uniref:semaphorin-4B-like isoform X2 n=1 Tax=Heterodontus francisci TaxID=7792 RepID=UPI00355C5142